MKQCILVLGVIASIGFTYFPLKSAKALESYPQISVVKQDAGAQGKQYTGNNEDGESEDVTTGKGKVN